MWRPHRSRVLIVLVGGFLTPLTSGTAGASEETSVSRISTSTAGDQAEAYSGGAEMTPDGRYVVFISDASNLVPDDVGGFTDVFLRDTHLGTTERVSVSSNEEEGNGRSVGWPLAISADGRYVAFTSEASNLAPGDTHQVDVFVRDRLAGTTELVSRSSAGRRGNGLSWPGVALSADGRYVAFESEASNLVAGDTNREVDVFVRDRVTGSTARMSVATSGAQGRGGSRLAGISADGKLVVFSSWAENLVRKDANDSSDVFIRNRVARTTRRVSVNRRGTQGNDASVYASMSADGRYVVFVSWASNLVRGDTNGRRDVFVRDRENDTTRRVSVSSSGRQANAASWEDSDGPEISGDGRHVMFESRASNLVRGDTNKRLDVFVHDRIARTTRRVSVSSTGVQGRRHSYSGTLSADGQIQAFESYAGNLVAGDTNATGDIFLRAPSEPGT